LTFKNTKLLKLLRSKYCGHTMRDTLNPRETFYFSLRS